MRKIYLIVYVRKKLTQKVLVLLSILIIFAAVCACFFAFMLPLKTMMVELFNVSDSNLHDGGYKEGKLAIIIDDFGQSREGVQEMMQINRHITFAVMPFLQFSESDARRAHEKGYEVIIHIPMESNKGKIEWLGPRPILADTKIDDIKKIVSDSFENIPFAVGANIHMGSKASGDKKIMAGVLEIIKEKNAYFVDSRTAEKPVSKEIADQMGVVCFERDIFIDGQVSKQHVKKQLEKCINLAMKKGQAIAIGHVGVEGGRITAQAIEEMLPEFDSKGIELVFVSELKQKS